MHSWLEMPEHYKQTIERWLVEPSVTMPASYTYPQIIEKYFPTVGDLTDTCPHCGKKTKGNHFSISPTNK